MADRVLVDGDRMPGARWFEGARLNFAENLLRRDDASAGADLRRRGRQPARAVLGRALQAEVRGLAAALQADGVGVGDRVAGYLPNIPETIIAMLATTALGRGLVLRPRPISASTACSTGSARSSPRC